MTVEHLSTDFHKPLSDDAAASYTMPSLFYTDPNVFEQEKRAIFAKTWHYIGHEAQVRKTGDYLTLQIAHENVFVIRGQDGELRGFFNVCRHRAQPGTGPASGTASWQHSSRQDRPAVRVEGL